jgi:hypothetical protein
VLAALGSRNRSHLALDRANDRVWRWERILGTAVGEHARLLSATLGAPTADAFAAALEEAELAEAARSHRAGHAWLTRLGRDSLHALLATPVPGMGAE